MCMGEVRLPCSTRFLWCVIADTSSHSTTATTAANGRATRRGKDAQSHGSDLAFRGLELPHACRLNDGSAPCSARFALFAADLAASYFALQEPEETYTFTQHGGHRGRHQQPRVVERRKSRTSRCSFGTYAHRRFLAVTGGKVVHRYAELRAARFASDNSLSHFLALFGSSAAPSFQHLRNVSPSA